MKKIRRTNRFKRLYKERIGIDERLRRDFIDSLETFLEDRTLVDDHSLGGIMTGQRAFSINQEYRIVYIERDDYYQFLDVGTHEQVYRR
jgi:mRNA-degrading endonuclease YafQ of YafQ-DinJ toxin-antitoxin module